MARLVVTWIGLAGHVFHGVLEILYFQTVVFDASIALLVAIVECESVADGLYRSQTGCRAGSSGGYSCPTIGQGTLFQFVNTSVHTV